LAATGKKKDWYALRLTETETENCHSFQCIWATKQAQKKIRNFYTSKILLVLTFCKNFRSNGANLKCLEIRKQYSQNLTKPEN
jgi:hypothetical protein